MNPGGHKSGSGTPYSVSEFVGLETDADERSRVWNAEASCFEGVGSY